MLAVDEIRNQVHRPGSIQGHQGNDVLEAVGPRALEQVAHAARFKLEYRTGVGTGEHRIGTGIVQRQGFQHDLRMAHVTQIAQGPVQHRERGQSKEVELHQTDGLDIILVQLRHHAV